MKKRILAILLCLALTTAVMPAAAFADGDAPEITSVNLTHGYDYVKYSFDIQSKNTGNAVWSIAEGTLPDGLTLDPGTGTISGTPTKVGSWTFKVTVTTSAGSDERDFTITVNSAEPVITPDTTEPTVSDETGAADSSDITTVSQTDGAVTVAQSTSPETGITGSSSTLWIVLVIVAAAAVIAIVVVNKRKKKQDSDTDK